jgi:diguanylate cyclase (GGDEF)-like protein/PAS domain S-box-containing protein
MNRAPIRRLRLPLLAAACVFLAAVWTAVAYQLHQLRTEAIESASRHGENITAVVGEHFLVLAGSIEGTLKQLREQWVRDPRRFSATVGEHVSLPGHMLNQLIVADAAGRVVYPAGATRSVDGTDYFVAARAARSDQPAVGRPERGYGNGKIGIPFAVAIRREGAFRGVLVVSIAADELIRAYKAIDLGPGGFITLRQNDGSVVARSADFESLLGGPRPEWQHLEEFAAPTGSYMRRAPSDGVERIFSYRKLAGYPLIAVAGQELEGALARYYEQRRTYLAAGALISLALLLLVGVTLARLKRVELAEKDLRESENRYRTLTGLFADWYWELDQDDRLVALTPNSPSARAREQAQWHQGKRPWEMRYANADDPEWRRLRELLASRVPFRDVALKVSGSRGRTAYLNVRGHPVYDGAGVFKGYRGITKDVTQEKRDERLLQLEHAVNRCLAAADDVPAALTEVMRAICEAEHWQCGRYWSLDRAAQLLRYEFGWGADTEAIRDFLKQSGDLVFGRGVGLAGIVWQTGRPLWVEDITKDRRVTVVVARPFNMHGAFVFPATAGGEVIGVFGFTSHAVREPDERLLQAIRVVGSQIGQFIQRKEAEEVLRRSEERFRSLTDLSSDWYWEQDEELRFVAMTQEIMGKTGVSAETHIGKRRWEIPAVNMSEAQWARHRAVVEAHLPFHDLELCRLAEDGRPSWVLVSGDPILDASGRFKGYRGIGKDITQRKREEELRALEHAVNRDLADADDVHECLKAVIRTVCESQAWDCGRYFAVDEESNVLRFAEAWGIDEPAIQSFIASARKLVYSPGQGLSGHAWRSGEPLWSTDVTRDGRSLKGVASSLGIHGAFVFPVMAGGKTIGVLNFSSRQAREPDARLLQAIRVVGRQIGQFVQRKQSEEVLRQSEERFRSLTQLSSDVYWEQDDQYRFTSFSENGPRWISADTQKLIGRRRWDQHYLNMTPEAWAGHIADLDARKPFRDLELCRLNEREGRVWVSVSGEPIFDRLGAFRGYRGVGKDITGRKREEELLHLEHSVTRHLSEADGISGALRTVIREVCESQRWECGRYFYADEKAGLLRFGDAWGKDDPTIQRYIEASRDYVSPLDRGSKAQVWRTGEPLWSSEISRHGHLVQSTLGSARDSFVFAVTAESRPIGVLSFTSRGVREPDARLLQAVRVIGSQVGQFLRRKESEEGLQRFRAAMDASADMFWLIDPVEMRIIDVNDTACRTLGYSREELLAMGPHEIISTPRDELSEVYRKLVAGDLKEIAVSGSYRRKDGTMVPMESMRRAIRSGDGHVIIAAARDITERLEREEELSRFHLAMDNSADMIVLIDRATMRFVDVNSTACRLLGYSREELLKLGPHDVLPVSREELERSYDELIANPSRPSGMNTVYRCRDGTQLPFESTRRILRSGDRYIIAAISRDIRERLAAEEALRRSNERFNLAVRATNDVIWDWDLAGDEVWWNENLKRVFGYASENNRSGAFWKRSIHPEDRDRIVSGIRELIGAGRDNWSDEYRFLRSDGSYAHVLNRGHAVRDAAGKAVRMIGAMTDITMRKEAEEKLAYLAQFDSLTGLPNRHLFRDRLMQAMARAKRTGKAMAVLFIDLDRFKLVNDTLGHGAGDQLLKEATQRLQACMRASDTVGRFGGDEFGAVITDLAKPGDASVVAQKIIDALARPFDLDGHESYVTASIGITLFPTDGEEAGTLIMNADAAMYRAKEQGRNTYQYFTREMNERAMQRVTMESALRRAIERKEFLLHYQPKVKIASGEVCGFEALLRWQHPEQGLVPPLQFIPVLEDTGLIVPVGEWVIGEVCEQIARWRRARFRTPPVAVNLSARQFQQKGLEATVDRALRRSGIAPDLLQFELTESLLMKEPEVAARTLRSLKKLGVALSVDDFGTGYSSLSYLKRFPIDALKIDRTFIRDVTVDADDAAITFAIIGLAHSLKLSVIAEGVETRDQLRFLEAHGCDEMQGFLFSRPVTAEECGHMLREDRKLAEAPSGDRRRRAVAGRA